MKRLLIVPLLFVHLIVSATKYYVKNTGSDSNTGLSEMEAWAHHPWMSTWTGKINLAPGDSVCMKRGDIWSIATPSKAFMTVLQSGSKGSYITTTWFGNSGPRPLIQINGNYNVPVIQSLGKSYIVFDNLEIKHFSSVRGTSGQSGIVISKDYSNSNLPPHDWIISNCEIHNIPFVGIYGRDDSFNIVVGDISAKTCATSLSYSNHIHDCGYAGVVLSGRDPDSDQSNWQVIYNYIHNIDFDGGEVRDVYGIVFSSQNTGTGRDFSDGWPSNCHARFNRIENIPGHSGIDSHGGTNIFIQDNYIYNCMDGIVTQAVDRPGYETAVLSNIYIERNTIENPATNPLGSRCFIYVVGENGINVPRNCYIRNNILFYRTRPTSEIGAVGIATFNVDGIIIEENKIFNGPSDFGGLSDAGIRIGKENSTVKNVTVNKNWILNWDHGIFTYAGSVNSELKFNNNIIFSHGRAFMVYGGEFSGNIQLFNNTIFSSPNANYPYAVDFSGSELATNGSVIIRNNIAGLINPGANGYYILSPSVIEGDFIVENNLYWNFLKAKPFHFKGVYTTWEEWNSNGYDINGLIDTNPNFRNLSGSFSQDIDFTLTSNSPAINKGIVSGLSSDYAGNPIIGLPDIGAFEYQTTQTPPPAPSVPLYASSVIENTTPARLDITFNLSLASIVPATSAFTVMVNSNARNVSSVTVSGTRVTLTLSSPVAYGNSVTVAYTKPSTEPLQTSAGGQAASFTAQTVTNRVAAPPPAPAVPAYISSIIENSTPARLDINFDLAIANIVPAASAFTVMVNSTARTVSSVAVSGTRVTLTLSSPVAYGNTVTVAYTRPSANPLQTSAGGYVASFSARQVTNRVAQPAPAAPVYVSSLIENATPARIEISFDLTLANIVPAASAFTVMVNSTARTVSSVAVSGTRVTLTLSSPVAYGNTVTVAYTRPSANPLQTASGGQAGSFVQQSVTNKVAAINNPPVVVVNYQKSIYSGFVYTLNATGSFDKDMDNLSFSWTNPSGVPVSASTGPIIKFLGPAVTSRTNMEFIVNVSDGKTTQAKSIPIEIVPYKPDLDVAEIINIEASSHYSQNYPYNVIDGSIGTMWSANGIDEWLIVELKEPFNVQNVTLAFMPGQKTESFFDVYGSDDKESWDPILMKSSSCGFSGDIQAFEFPASKAMKEYKYLKISGQGNSSDSWNYISEIKILGFRHPDPLTYENLPVKLYPNPVSEFVNVRIDEPSIAFNFIKIINLTGKIIYHDEISPEVREFQVPVNFKNGLYILQMGSDNITHFSSKLIVSSR